MKVTTHLVAAASGGLMAAMALGSGDGTRGTISVIAHGVLFAAAHLLPDVDLLSRRGGGQAFLRFHRGVTHSLLFALALPWVLATPMLGLGVRQYLTGAAAAGAGGLFHLFLDFFNPYPMALFWPLSKRVSCGLIYFRDYAVVLILAISLFLFRAPTAGLVVFLVFMLLYLVLRGVFRIIVQVRFPFFQRHLGREKVEHVAFVPDPWMPWAWKVAIRTDDAYHVWNLDILAGRAVARDRFDRRESGVCRRARATDLVRALDAVSPFFYLAEEAPPQPAQKGAAAAAARGAGISRVTVEGHDVRFHYYGRENPFRVRLQFHNNDLVKEEFL